MKTYTNIITNNREGNITNIDHNLSSEIFFLFICLPPYDSIFLKYFGIESNPEVFPPFQSLFFMMQWLSIFQRFNKVIAISLSYKFIYCIINFTYKTSGSC